MSVRRSLQAIPSVLGSPQMAAASIPSPTHNREPNSEHHGDGTGEGRDAEADVSQEIQRRPTAQP